ncbi:ROK family protein [Spiroplasma endosymbiont of Crioceris asparagi]|uniref:ROK family protein n=1 Tax=Spiroplasma endosymbiont of Crioceris asparagi TaxID=3066286 RepID=UPI0030CB150D
MKIGIDIGGTSIRVGSIINNKINKIEIFKNDVKHFQKMIDKIFSIIDQLKDDQKIESIGIASPGPLDIENGIILNTPNLETWNNKNIKEIFYAKYKVQININNDANVAALGQYIIKNEKKPIHSILYFTISTGLGAGFVNQGKIFSGSKGLALEVYNAIPDLSSDKVTNSGIEFIASGKNIELNLQKLGVNISSAKEAFEMYKNNNNKVVNNYFLEMKNRLVQFFTTAIYFFNPSQVVLGGSVALHNKDFYINVFEEVKSILNSGGFDIKLSFAENIDEATLLGCSKL